MGTVLATRVTRDYLAQRVRDPTSRRHRDTQKTENTPNNGTCDERSVTKANGSSAMFTVRCTTHGGSLRCLQPEHYLVLPVTPTALAKEQRMS
jgi:hypothetical protein